MWGVVALESFKKSSKPCLNNFALCLSLVIAFRLCNGLCDIDLGEMCLNFSLFGLSQLGASTFGVSDCLELACSNKP